MTTSMMMLELMMLCAGYESRRSLVELPTQRELSLRRPLLRVHHFLLVVQFLLIRQWFQMRMTNLDFTGLGTSRKIGPLNRCWKQVVVVAAAAAAVAAVDHLFVHFESKKWRHQTQTPPYLHCILTDFQNCFRTWLSGKFAIEWWWWSHHTGVVRQIRPTVSCVCHHRCKQKFLRFLSLAFF